MRREMMAEWAMPLWRTTSSTVTPINEQKVHLNISSGAVTRRDCSRGSKMPNGAGNRIRKVR